MIQVENNPRANVSGGGASAVTLVEPANDAEMLTDVVPEETDGGSFKQQGWIPMVARRKERLIRLALLDGVNTTPNAEEQANGIGVPTESLSGNFRDLNENSLSYRSLNDPAKKRLPKLTRQPDQEGLGIEDMKL